LRSSNLESEPELPLPVQAIKPSVKIIDKKPNRI
jgi:hypothetical protein